MTRAGRPPKPSHLQIISGTFRPDRKSKSEPKPKLAIPLCPPHLNEEAKREWHRMAKELFTLGLLTKIDKAVLAAYCQSWALWVEASEELKKTGLVLKSPNGYPIQSPYLAIMKQAMKDMQSQATEFGLTPASRSRIHAQPVEKEDENAKKEKRFFG